MLYLIEILHQTTTGSHSSFAVSSLYLIEILHQTTTKCLSLLILAQLYLIEILHQTTTISITWPLPISCILLKFYIKPQLRLERELSRCVVSYWNSTSNHNHQTNPKMGSNVVSYWNSTSNHNHGRDRRDRRGVVSYWNSTSNHNVSFPRLYRLRLYLIEILHQTTTTAAATTSDS